MSDSVTLMLLRCTECQSNLSGEKEGVFLYCGGCGAGFRLEDGKLLKIPVYFAKAAQNPQSYVPFWAFDATLELHNVEAKKGIKSMLSDRGGLVRLFQERGTVRMYVSASQGDLEAQRPRALQLTLDQPELEYVNHQPKVEGFTVALDDAEKVADFLFLTSEIEQPDMMRNLEYKLSLNNPMVVIIGF